MATSIFLDTNVFLSFYHFSNEDLQELEKLLALIKSKEVILYLPQQTKEEFRRNRDTKINDAIKKIREEKLTSTFPQICKDFEQEYENIKESVKQYEKNKQIIVNNIIEHATNNSLKADITIKKLFDKAELIETTEEVIRTAKMRFDLGNPPGKNKSYGDAINWETLLGKVDTWDDFYFISDDSDYYSVLDKELFNSYLFEEWRVKNSSDLKYYKRLSLFLKEKYPQIIIASEYEKDNLINRLASSNNFASTHSIIRSLREFDRFTEKQVNDFVYAAISNSQIYWISEDLPIARFMQEIYEDYSEIIEEDYIHDYTSIYGIEQ